MLLETKVFYHDPRTRLSKNRTIVNIYALNSRDQYMKQKLAELKGEIEKSKMIIEPNILFLMMNRITRKKINEEIED